MVGICWVTMTMMTMMMAMMMTMVMTMVMLNTQESVCTMWRLAKRTRPSCFLFTDSLNFGLLLFFPFMMLIIIMTVF